MDDQELAERLEAQRLHSEFVAGGVRREAERGRAAENVGAHGRYTANEQRCGTCAYGVEAQPGVRVGAADRIACHRYPPTISESVITRTTRHPYVDEDDWCGEWRQR